MTLPYLWFVFFCSFIIPNKNLRSFSQRQINNGATISLTKLQLKQRLFMSKSQEWNNKKENRDICVLRLMTFFIEPCNKARVA